MKRQIFKAAAAAAAGGFVYAAYRKDLKAAMKRIDASHTVLDLPGGPIQFAESGDGPAALVIHGAGGGFDQGLDLGHDFLGHAHRVIAPSRFGYLGTPMPEDASPEAQADAYAQLLDALEIERLPVIAVSAGAPSAMQFAVRHPNRCAALVLMVPLAYPTKFADGEPPDGRANAIMNFMFSSDFLFWLATKVAHRMMVEKILGTPIEEYGKATKPDRKRFDDLLRNILPVTRRAAGLANEAVVGSRLTRYELEKIIAPTLVITAADCLYGTFDGSVYTAESVASGTLVAFTSGGHLLAGHREEVQSQIAAFLRQAIEAPSLSASPV